LYVKDPATSDRPEIWEESSVWSTPSCIVVGCLPDCDGETEITIGAAREVGMGRSPLFDGRLDTPSRVIGLEIVPRQKVLEVRVPNVSTRVQVWTSGGRDPDKVIIGLD
jgi:hypothetical protein